MDYGYGAITQGMNSLANSVSNSFGPRAVIQQFMALDQIENDRERTQLAAEQLGLDKNRQKMDKTNQSIDLAGKGVSPENITGSVYGESPMFVLQEPTSQMSPDAINAYNTSTDAYNRSEADRKFAMARQMFGDIKAGAGDGVSGATLSNYNTQAGGPFDAGLPANIGNEINARYGQNRNDTINANALQAFPNIMSRGGEAGPTGELFGSMGSNIPSGIWSQAGQGIQQNVSQGAALEQQRANTYQDAVNAQANARTSPLNDKTLSKVNQLSQIYERLSLLGDEGRAKTIVAQLAKNQGVDPSILGLVDIDAHQSPTSTQSQVPVTQPSYNQGPLDGFFSAVDGRNQLLTGK